MSRILTFEKQHFCGVSDPQASKDLFRRSVSNVIIELFSYCNRQCPYCPVSLVDRISSNNYLDRDLFDMIISNLRSIDYAEGICLNLYNEPLAERELLLSSIRSLRQHVPHARIYFSSNGDYLEREYLRELVEAGLTEMYVTLHPPKGQPYSDIYSLNRFSELSARMSVGGKFSVFQPNTTIQAIFSFSGLNVHVFSTNYLNNGQNRGGLMKNVRLPKARTAPCERVFADFTVSYDGTVFPCCQLFADSDSHKPYAIGNLSQFDSIFQAYASEHFAVWRRNLLVYGEKTTPCDSCSESDSGGNQKEIEERDQLYRSLVGPLPPRSAHVCGDLLSSARSFLRKVIP
jgi:radical SAM protein with 4Fe4S-binding SPASM domain